MTSPTVAETLPVVPHLAGEFYLWLWWSSETQGGTLRLPDPVLDIELWVDQRLAFRNPQDNKVSAVLTGEHPSETLEAKAAVYGGKVLHELRLRIVRDDRQFVLTLKGPEMHFSAVKFPQSLQESPEEAIYDRVFLYEELGLIVQNLLDQFVRVRTSKSWENQVFPAIRAWIAGHTPPEPT